MIANSPVKPGSILPVGNEMLGNVVRCVMRLISLNDTRLMIRIPPYTGHRKRGVGSCSGEPAETLFFDHFRHESHCRRYLSRHPRRLRRCSRPAPCRSLSPARGAASNGIIQQAFNDGLTV